ncbi:MAG: hypothetical protein ACJ77K_06740 [Bacteroidia bacterium]
MKLFTTKQANKFRQKAAFVMALIMLNQIVFPTVSLALTGGPAAPEFSSFEPVATTGMVDEFSGDFTYNIPVLNVPGAAGGGYAMSLSYHSGESVENEASWVGYGWTLNPGSISRSKQGIADDTKNTYTYYNEVPKNWTVSTGVSVGNLELFSFGIPVSVNGSIRYNNYRGFGYTTGAGLSFSQGLVTLGYSVSDGTGSFSAQVNPAALLSGGKKKREEKEKATKAKYNDFKTADDKKRYQTDKKKERGMNPKSAALSRLGAMASNYGMYALSDQQHPTTATPYDGFAFNTNFNLQTNPAPLEVGPQFGFTGSYNYQKNKPAIDRTGYGYLYSSLASGDDGSVMDYHTERDALYNKRDRYMAIPFSSPDIYSVSGEGMGGAFRLYNRTIGHFRPNAAHSSTLITQIAGDISLGLEYGGGFNLGLGQQTLDVSGSDWGSGYSGNTGTYTFQGNNGTAEDDESFFRFNNDLGGDLNYGGTNTDETVKADVTVNCSVPGAKRCSPNIDGTKIPQSGLQSSIPLESGTVGRSGRASYIGFHTNTEMGITSSTKPVYAYERTSYSSSLVDRGTYGDQIGEIATTNEDGNLYVYGLPVYVKNETSLQYDLQGASGGDIDYNFRAKKDVSSYHSKIGQVDNGAYASSYLLTQITTPDYIDRTLNGPSIDDFGGYTQFTYVKPHSISSSGSSGSYHYRMPYSGLNYSRNELSDNSDDMGSYFSGDKDIAYLDQIVTKTHIAKFIRSSRADGIDAAGDATAAADYAAKGTQTLEKLDAIELYTNNNGSTGKLIKKVIFKYDYSLTQGIPNTSNTTSGTTGKLTLKEVWFEYDGVVTAKISPYKFEYAYPKSTGSDPRNYPAKYDSFQNEYGDNTTAFVENPNYSSFAIDAWGNYQDEATGQYRFGHLKEGLNQGTPTAGFDPAAWQLKVIKLPSGGEIHVQYEQDDYLYVQDQRAACLVSINEDDEASNTGDYTLNASEIGVSTSELPDLAQLIKAQYTNDKIYFKFLYALMGTSPDLDKCNTDYVSGYVNFQDAYVSSGALHIVVGNGGSGYDLPRDICLDLVKKQKGGKLDIIGNCNADASGVSDGLSVKDMVMQLIGKIGTSFFAEGSCCLKVKPELSYFRIPVLHPKKGGGLRVKRVLMFDKNGIDNNVAGLYGTEYFYQTENGQSSGVATNETPALRDENPLVTFLPKRNEQSFLSKVVSGTDREQFEGPIGESLLPSASVGYSRVVSKNIHSGKNNTGFVVNEFYTCKDYPFGMYYNNGATKGIDNTDIEKEKDWMNLPAVVFNYSVSNIWAAQGYRFMLNSMHGQPKTVATYSGDYIGGSLVSYAKSSSTEYQYFQPGEEIPVMDFDGVTITNKNPGKDMDVTMEMRSVEDVTEDASLEIDFGVGIAGVIPLPQASLSPLVNYTESKMRTHVTSKVIRYPAIQKAVITSQDGIVHRTENLAFSEYTGKPVKTRTTDGYDGLDLQITTPEQHGEFTSYATPAYTQYTEMGQKAINDRLIMIPGSGSLLHIDIGASLSAGHYHLDFTADPGYQVCDAMNQIVKGDLIKVTASTGSGYYHVDEITGSSLEVLPALLYNAAPGSFTGSVTRIEVIRSGRTNQLNTMAGGYITYGEEQPITTVAPNPTIAAQWGAFITALNGTLPSGGTLAFSSYPSVTATDASCTALTGDVTVSAVSGTSFSLASSNPADLVLNSDFSSTDATCVATYGTSAFANGCVDNWTQAYGNPLLASGNVTLQSFGAASDGILQNLSGLVVGKSYTINIDELAPSGGVNGTLYACLVDPTTSGLPMGHSFPLSSPPGTVIHSNTYSSSMTPGIYSSTFTFTDASKTQLVIYGKDVSGAGGQGLRLHKVEIFENGDCTTDLYTNHSGSDYGHFGYDEAGNILFYSADNNCHPQTVGCFKFCGANPGSRTLAKVVTSNATTFACSWPYDVTPYTAVTSNVYESGAKGKWRPEESFVYKSSIVGGSKTGTSERNYNDAGVYTMTLFNWDNVAFNDANKWVKTTTVKKYSPNGEGIEEKDAIGIYSAAKFGYSGTVPYLVAQNSSNDHVQFQSFEKSYGTSGSSTKMEDGVLVATAAYYNPGSGNIAHSGKGSFRSSGTSVSLSMKPFTADAHTLSKGLSCKLWVKDASHAALPVTGEFTTSGSSISFAFTKVAQTGEWTLYEAKVTSGFLIGVTYTPVIKNNVGTVIYLDDVRLQPLDAQVNTYVYDPATLRLLASFDDQHFGLFYQYNQEGKLVRKMIETENGLKTITETQYHTPLEARP